MDAYLPPPPEDWGLTPAMSPKPLRLVLIEDEASFARELEALQSESGRFIRVFYYGPEVEEVVAARPNAVIVELRLLRWRAWKFILGLRDALPDAGIIVCTVEGTLDQRLAGLRLGADDWISKPCDPREVLARAEISVRRVWRGNASRGMGVLLETEAAQVGELELRSEQLQAFVGTRSADLTPRQFSLSAAQASAAVENAASR